MRLKELTLMILLIGSLIIGIMFNARADNEDESDDDFEQLLIQDTIEKTEDDSPNPDIEKEDAKDNLKYLWLLQQK